MAKASAVFHLSSSGNADAAYLKLEQRMRSAEKQAKRTARSSRTAMTQMSRLGTLLGGGSAIALVGMGMRLLAQQTKTATTALVAQVDAIKRLNQVANSAKDLRFLLGSSRDISTGAGIGIGASHDLLFRMRSLEINIQKGKRTAKDLSFIEPNMAPVFEGAVAIEKTFGKESLGGSLRSKIVGLVAAAKMSRVDVGSLAGVMRTAAQNMSRIGGSAEELLAMMATMSKTLRSSEIAATALARMTDAIAKNPSLRRISEKEGAIAAVLAVLRMSDRRQEAIFHEIRAFKGFSSLSKDLGGLEKIMALIAEEIAKVGTGDDLLTQGKERALKDPLLGPAGRLQRAEQRLKISREPLAAVGAERDAIIAIAKAVNEKKLAKSGLGRGIEQAPLAAAALAASARQLSPKDTAKSLAGFLDTEEQIEFERILTEEKSAGAGFSSVGRRMRAGGDFRSNQAADQRRNKAALDMMERMASGGRDGTSQYAREVNNRKIRAAEKIAVATEKAVRRNEEPFLKPRDKESSRGLYHQDEF